MRYLDHCEGFNKCGLPSAFFPVCWLRRARWVNPRHSYPVSSHNPPFLLWMTEIDPQNQCSPVIPPPQPFWVCSHWSRGRTIPGPNTVCELSISTLSQAQQARKERGRLRENMREITQTGQLWVCLEGLRSKEELGRNPNDREPKGGVRDREESSSVSVVLDQACRR